MRCLKRGNGTCDKCYQNKGGGGRSAAPGTGASWTITAAAINIALLQSLTLARARGDVHDLLIAAPGKSGAHQLDASVAVVGDGKIAPDETHGIESVAGRCLAGREARDGRSDLECAVGQNVAVLVHAAISARIRFVSSALTGTVGLPGTDALGEAGAPRVAGAGDAAVVVAVAAGCHRRCHRRRLLRTVLGICRPALRRHHVGEGAGPDAVDHVAGGGIVALVERAGRADHSLGIDVLSAGSRRAVHDVLVSRGEGRRGRSCEKQHAGGGDEEWEGGWRKAAHLVLVISISDTVEYLEG
mmetsp:Transcript_13571/g.32223  ORF Transcript_13571/g.32223 Transcript_13571/m.32223 type:complete len:300 (+) Transcript_13571:112-1011(+)